MYEQICSELAPYQAKLAAVSKTRPASDIAALYAKGQRIFSENRVQELLPKFESLPKDIRWHFIGHLQKNKVKQIASFIDLIESVDSLDLLLEIDKQASRNHRVISCLLEFHIAQEESKYGLSLESAREILSSDAFQSLKNIHIAGVMGMATFTEDKAQIRQEFHSLRLIFEELKQTYFPMDATFCEISMGMSSDYPIALEEGSTIVRIGTLLFGTRL